MVNILTKIETNLEPRALLGFLKQIEMMVGRTPSIRNGPRVVDLDIITYDAEILDSRDEKCRSDLDNLEGELVVPHPRMIEREFVLRPMNELRKLFLSK
jgi:dihydroneopterin aldolase/2-amino-4-hydroxy-6-hydroxymethyldihydropteridine diphosphokinase/dihydropteroate synthase